MMKPSMFGLWIADSGGPAIAYLQRHPTTGKGWRALSPNCPPEVGAILPAGISSAQFLAVRGASLRCTAEKRPSKFSVGGPN